MKSKLFSLGLLTVILSIALLSAADFSVSQPAALSKSVNSTSFTITNNNETKNVTLIVPKFVDISDENGHKIIIDRVISTENGVSVSGDEVTIPAKNSTKITLSYSSLSPSGTEVEDLALGTFKKSIEIVNKDNTNERANVTLSFISSFCEKGNLKETIEGDTRFLEIESIKDKSSEEDWEWKPTDEVEIEVKVKFESGDKDDEIDAIIEIGLYDTEEREFIDLDDDEELEKEISLEEGERATEIFNIQVPIEDIKDSKSRYKLYAKVYEDGSEDEVCTDKLNGDDYFQDITIKKESRDVVLRNIEITSPVPCEEEAELKAKVYNIGSHDEEKVRITLINKELNLDLQSDIRDLDEGDSDTLNFNFKVPKEIEEKIYELELIASFDYRKSSDSYDETSEKYTAQLKVEGNCKAKADVSKAQITAELDPETPEAIAGRQVIINANLKNTGDLLTTYTISVLENAAWSKLISIQPQIAILEPGASKDINIVLSLNEEAEGEKEFVIKASHDSKITEQKVALLIQKSQETDYSKIAEHLRANWFIYVIILINLILIIAIIIVVRRMVSMPRAR